MRSKATLGILTLLLALSPALAQYVGTYTIKPDGSGNFRSFTEAADSLRTYGISGNCIFEAYTGIYRGRTYLYGITTGSYTITFRPATGQEVRINSGTTYAFHIQLTNNIKLENLSIRSDSTALFLRQADGCRIERCRLTSPTGVHIYWYCDRDTITGNEIRGTMPYCVRLEGYDLERSRGIVIANNAISGWTEAGIYASYHDSTRFVYNTLHTANATAYCIRDEYGYRVAAYNNTYSQTSSSASAVCYHKRYGQTLVSDYNCFWKPAGGIVAYYDTTKTWPEWRSLGLDGNGIDSDPLLVPANQRLRPGSPCIGAATPIAGITSDIDGDTRDLLTPDIGCDEWNPPQGPMAGLYTVRQDGTGDFRSVHEATADLIMRGASADVVFDIYEGEYYDNIWLEDVDNGSYSVTYRAHEIGGIPDAVTLNVYGAPHAVHLNDVDRIRFVNLEVTGFGTTTGYGFYFDSPASPYTGCDGCVVTGCNISGPNGIYLHYGCDRDSIYGNSIMSVNSYGIRINGRNDSQRSLGTVVANNMLHSWTGFGIYARFHDSTLFGYNTILGNRGTGQCVYDYYGYNVTSRNNILTNTYGGTNALAYYRFRGSALSSNYNCFWCPSAIYGRVARVYPGSYCNWSQWQSYGYDANGINRNPLVGGPNDLHLRNGSPCVDGGTPLAGFGTDIDGDARDPSSPDIGADEWTNPGGAEMSGVYTVKVDSTGDYVDLIEALGDLRRRGFGGDVRFDVYSGSYAGMVDLEGIGNDTFYLTLRGYPDEDAAVVTDTSYAFHLWGDCRRIRIEGFTVSGHSNYAFFLQNAGTVGVDSCVIRGNTVNGGRGVYIGSYSDADTIDANTIHCTSNYGIYQLGTSADKNSHNVFTNNMINGFTSYGMYFSQTDSCLVAYNSIFGTGSYAFYSAVATGMTMLDNIYRSNSYAYYHYLGDLAPAVSDHNCFYNGSDDVIGHSFFGAMTLAEWRETVGRDSSGMSANPRFVSSDDLHLLEGSPCIHAGTPVPGVTTDIDGDARHVTDPDIGADETDFTFSRDAAVIRVNAPVGPVAHLTTVAPSFDLTNYGTTPITVEITCVLETGVFDQPAPRPTADNAGAGFPVRDGRARSTPLRPEPGLGALDSVVYDTTEFEVFIAPADTVTFDFDKAWLADPVGGYYVTAWVYSAFDDDHSNDTLQATFTVVGADVGVSAILAPVGILDTNARVDPSARVSNLGLASFPFDAWFVITDTAADQEVYRESVYVAGFEPGADTVIQFPVWFGTPVEGPHIALCSLAVNDDNAGNDTLSVEFYVRSRQPWEPGWFEVASMPTAPSGRPVKRGGWLCYDHAGALIYAAKGYKTNDFYVYDPTADAWSILTGMPYQSHPLWASKPPRKGARGISDGDGVMYVTQGNNSLGFWRYTADEDSWTIMPDVPLGANNKKVKGGTDMVHVSRGGNEYVYLLKGYRNEFYRFNTATTSWEIMPDAPVGVRAKWDKGSWLVHDGDRSLYAHKAKYNELWRYDLARDSWDTSPLTGMPLVGRSGRRKKSKDGGSAGWDTGAVFALKGGNTQEFWRYQPVGDSWAELDTIPAVGSTGRKKRVKHGGDFVTWGTGAFFALKGNKTTEMWRYIPWTARGARPQRDGMMARPTKLGRSGIRVAPNPLSGDAARVRYNLPLPGPATVTVFDVAGRRVAERSFQAGRSGSVNIDVRHLSAGIYLVRFDAPGLTTTRKLVLER